MNLPPSALRQAADRAGGALSGPDRAGPGLGDVRAQPGDALDDPGGDDARPDDIQRTFVFPKMTDFSVWRAIPRVRHSKFASNCGVADNVAIREFAVRHAIRQLAIPAEAFPVEAELLYQVRETPPPGEPPARPDEAAGPPVAPVLPVPDVEEAQP